MKLLLKRTFLGEKYTIGKLFVDGCYLCDTLEDVTRDRNKNGSLNDVGEGKIYGETSIPYGTYKVVVNRSPKFGRDLPRILDVPHFDGVLFHRGNTAKDSAGCVLLGENTARGVVTNSTKYEIELVRLCKLADLITLKIE